LSLFIRHFDHKTEGHWCDHNLLEPLFPRDVEQIVGRDDPLDLLISLTAFDGFGVKDHLSKFSLVTRGLRPPEKLRLVFAVGSESFLEVRPVAQHLPDRLLRCLRVMEVLEAIERLGGLNKHPDVRQTFLVEPSLSNQEVASVVEFG